MLKFTWVLSLIISNLIISQNFACNSPGLLDLTDRGSVTNTPCTLPARAVMVELGYLYQSFDHFGPQQTFPQETFFLGLEGNNELFAALPTYNQQLHPALTGVSAATFGIKHELDLTHKWTASVEGLLTPPSGSVAFGSQGLGVALGGILNYNIQPRIDFTMMLTGESTNNTGARFNSINPSCVLSYGVNDSLKIFAELFGKTQTTVIQNANYNADYGFLYLITPNVAVDAEFGVQLTHEMGAFGQYIGVGITLMS